MKIIRSEQNVARMRHWCHVCEKDIFPGSQYIRDTFREGKKHLVVCRHIHCDAMLSAWAKECCNTKLIEEHRHIGCEDLMQAWVRDRVCCNCENGYLSNVVYLGDQDQKDCFSNVRDIVTCKQCIDKILPPSVVGAALQSIRENQEGADLNGAETEK
mgnify:CR=1 FL=1